jgi:hypothetical protein
MAFDGNGHYNLPTPEFPAVSGEYILASSFNTILQDIAEALSMCLVEDGQQPLTQNLPAGGKKITGLAAGSSPGDSLQFDQIGVSAGNIVQVDQTLTAWTRAATTTLGTTLNGTLSDTSATIAAFNGVAGVTYHCRCLGAGSIAHSAWLNCIQSTTGFTTANGDTFDVHMLTSTTCILFNYVRKDGFSGSSTQNFSTALLSVNGTLFQKTGANVASAATLALNTQGDGNLVHITGTTPISAVTMTSGQWMRCIADAALPLTYHATNHRINGGASYTCEAGDTIDYFYDGVTVFGNVTRKGGSLVKVGTFNRDLAAASGDVAYSGVGFRPSAILFMFSKAGSTTVGWGFATPAAVGNTACYGANVWASDQTNALRAYVDASNAQRMTIASWDADGFTATWTKDTSPTGTINVTYLAIR